MLTEIKKRATMGALCVALGASGAQACSDGGADGTAGTGGAGAGSEVACREKTPR